MDGTSSGETTHNLLLMLAGRVDDDLLGRARELVAVSEDARAVELVTASLVAVRAVLPEQVRSALVAAARTARTDLDPGTMLPSARAEDGSEHRFAAPPDDDPVAGALLALPARSLAGCRVLLARRRTPAGSAPGPLPHPVVLVQAPPGGRPIEVLAYQIAVALERTGDRASVEVLTAGTAPSEYHSAALRSAAPVITADDAVPALSERARRALRREPPPAQPKPEPERPAVRRRTPDTAGLLSPPVQPDELFGAVLPTTSRPEPEHAEPERPAAVVEEEPAVSVADETAAEPPATEPPAEGPPAEEPDDNDAVATATLPTGGLRPAPVRAATPEPAPQPTPRPLPRPVPTATGRIRRPTVMPISRTSVPNPIPLVRRDGPTPIVRPLTPVEPVSAPAGTEDEVPEAPARESAPRHPVSEETSAFDSLSDPLNGPLNQPLLAPLLDPTIHEDDPLGVTGKLPAEDAPRPRSVADDAWSADWLSGTWAMAPSALDGPARKREPQPAPPPEPDEEEFPQAIAPEPSPRPAPRRLARHRYADEPAPPPEPEPEPTEAELDLEPEEFVSAEPEPRAESRVEEGLGLRAESLARLSEADRQLLARLQAELLDGRKPRVSRRAGIGSNGSAHNVTNGSGSNGHRSDPPDLAG